MKKRIVSLLLAISLVSSMAVTGCGKATQESTGTESSSAQEEQNISSEHSQITDEASSASTSEVTTDTQTASISPDNELKNLQTSFNFSDLYADETAFEGDMIRLEELAPEMEKFAGTLNTVDGLLAFIESPAVLEIREITSKANAYIYLLNTVNASDPWAKQAYSRYLEATQKVALAQAYQEPEIMSMSLEERQELFSNPKFEPYAYLMKKYTDPQYTVLGEEASVVSTIIGQSIHSSDIYSIFDNIELPRPTISYPDGTEELLTDSVYNKIVSSTEYDHDFRKEAYSLRNNMRAPYANTYASILDEAMRVNWSYAQIDGFDSTLEKALYDSDIEPEVYDKIIAFSHELLPKVYEYYDVQKQLTGLHEYMFCDLYQPTNSYEAKEISYEDAVNIGREGIKIWGDEYLENFDKIITSGHIDVYPSSTKTQGAAMMPAGNTTVPYVYYNFDGLESYTSTIVHEMGHAVYGYYSAENQPVYYNAPTIFTHEVASTANELMYHKYMVKNAENKDKKLFWLKSEINLLLGTILRQCMYSEFEDYCYKVIEAGGSLDASALSEKWIELEKLYYGDAVTITDDSGIDWARIPHLYYNYYVYQYATSITYAASICQQVEDKGQEEIDAYLNFLKAGGSAKPSDLLKIANVDPLDDATYEAAGEMLSNLIDEYIQLANS